MKSFIAAIPSWVWLAGYAFGGWILAIALTVASFIAYSTFPLPWIIPAWVFAIIPPLVAAAATFKFMRRTQWHYLVAGLAVGAAMFIYIGSVLVFKP